jgi:hypothetical protein
LKALLIVKFLFQHIVFFPDLLKRRKVKKEFLFKYLHAKRVSVEASADKSVFVSAVLQLWGSPTSTSIVANEEDSLPEAPAPSRNTSYSSLCNLDYGSQLSLGLGGLNALPLNLDLHSTDTNSSCGSPKTRRRRLTAAPAVTPPPIRISESFDNLDTMDDFEETNDLVLCFFIYKNITFICLWAHFSTIIVSKRN